MVSVLVRSFNQLLSVVLSPAAESKEAAANGKTTEELLIDAYKYVAENAINILYALVIFLIGRWIAKLIANIAEKAMIKAKIDPTLYRFAKNIVYLTLLIFAILAALAKVGIQTASFIAVLGAAGLAVGLALQGSLANFASGVLLAFFKPFRVGDFVEIGGKTGTVKEIHIFNTIINSPDNLRIILPNSQVTGGSITNYTVNGTRRVNLVIGISYEDDIKKAKEVIEKVLTDDERVLSDPAPLVAVKELADSSVNFVVRPWVKAADYWDIYFGMTERIKLALDANDITIPFPQRDVHIKNGKSARQALSA